MKNLSLMGIVNTTPDSFAVHCYDDVQGAVKQAIQMLNDGADIVDVGGESTRPGYTPVSIEEEKRRVIPVINGIKLAKPESIVSVDTMKSEVAEEALSCGAEIINDVSGMADKRMGQVVAASRCKYVYMHGFASHSQVAAFADSRGLYPKGEKQFAVQFMAELSSGIDHVLAAGVSPSQLIIDPGFGFSKRGLANLWLLNTLPQIRENFRDIPILIGASRKHFVCEAMGEEDVVKASVMFAQRAYELGATYFRVHDIAPHVNALA